MNRTAEKKHNNAARRLAGAMILIGALTLLNSGCTKRIYDVVYPTLNDGKYDTEFPYKDCSDQLERIAGTVKRLNHIAYYTAYIMPPEAKITRNALHGLKLRDLAMQTSTYHQTASGTATVIYSEGRRTALMTCAHIIYAPDTLVTYYQNKAGQQGPRIVQSVSIKQRHSNYIIDIPDGSDMQILAMDIRKDIAIIAKTSQATHRTIPVFDYPAGKARKLEWGSFVYVMGFPVGNKMITRGIVSNPKHDPSGSFLVDALFNRGFSGGLVLAIKDGVPNFELVGMAKSVSAASEYVLRPAQTVSQYQYDPAVAYTGDLYVKLKKDINYGITHALSMEAIREFFKENKSAFNRRGYYFDRFLEKADQ